MQKNLEKFSKSEKLLLQTFLKKASPFVHSMISFVKSLRNVVGLAGKYQKVNDFLYLCYQRCCDSSIYPNGPMLKEEAKAIKESFQDSNLDQFRASYG